MVPAPVERRQLPGHRQRSQILQHRQWCVPALGCGLWIGKISGIWQRYHLAALTRAREAAPIPARSDADRPAPAGWAALRLLADVDISFSRNCCWQIRRRTLELGRPAPMLTSASPGRGGGDGAGAGRAQRATGSSTTIANSAAPTVVQRLTLFAALTRAREAAPIPARSDADRPAPAGWAALRLLADVDSSFSRNCCWQIRRRTLELGRSAPMLTSASPGRGGGDGAGADRAQPATGSSTTIAKFRSTDSGSAFTTFAAPSARARRRRFQRALTPTDLHGPAGRRCGCWPTSPVLFSGIVVGRFRFGATLELGRSGAEMTMLRPLRRRRWCRRRSSAASYRVIDNRSQNPQHRQWWRSPSLAQRCGAADRKDQRNLAALTTFAASRARA